MGDFVYPFKEDGQHNGNIRQYRNKTVCVGHTESTLAVTVFHYSFVCFALCSASALQIVFSVSLYESTAKWETGQMYCRCAFSCSICNQMATSLGVFRAAVLKVMMTYHRSWEDIIS